MPASHRLDTAVWLWPGSRSFVLEWTKGEVTSATESMIRCNARELGAGMRPEEVDGAIIAVGREAIDRLGALRFRNHGELDALRREVPDLGPEEYRIHSFVRVDGRGSGGGQGGGAAPEREPRTAAGTGVSSGNDAGPVVAIAAGSQQALCWACFDLMERLGCTFRISGDVVPEGTNPQIPHLSVRATPAHAVRGVWFSYCFPTNSIMSLEDYHAFFGQMVKLRLNRFIAYHFENEPFVDFSFRGERKVVGDISHPTSGYISYGRHFSGSYLTEDVPIGGELFERERVAPLELQHVRSSDEALDEGVRFMRSVHRIARKFGITPWMSLLPAFVPMNFTKYTRRMPRPHMHWSALVSFTDPVIDEMNHNRITSVVRDYPELEGLYLGIPEGYYEDPYPESRAVIQRERPRYREAIDLHKRYWGKYWNNDETLLEAHIDRDIGFVEILKRSLEIARGIAPELKLGVMTVCKAYLLTLLHEDLPHDVGFADIESRSLWTVDGAPLHLFDRMRGRECAIIPRAVDDGSNAGLQHNLELYDLDRFLTSPEEHGTTGLIIQTTHIRGNEHNVGFLAKGMWNPGLRPTTFYRDYAQSLVGADASLHLERAFAVLEKNEQELGGRGQGNLPWNKVPLQIEILRRFRDYNQPFFGVPYHEGFIRTCKTKSDYYRKAMGRLDEAGRHFAAAAESLNHSNSCAAAAVREIDYLTSKNAGYQDHLRCLIGLGLVYKMLYELFASDLDPGKRRLALAEVTANAETAAGYAESSARFFARAVDHPTDLGVLWAINSSTVVGSRLLCTYVSNLLRFYRGEEYWVPVEWDRLFDRCPYPAYTLEEMEMSRPESGGEYEPG